jgi:hypothetical protein
VKGRETLLGDVVCIERHGCPRVAWARAKPSQRRQGEKNGTVVVRRRMYWCSFVFHLSWFCLIASFISSSSSIAIAICDWGGGGGKKQTKSALARVRDRDPSCLLLLLFWRRRLRGATSHASSSPTTRVCLSSRQRTSPPLPDPNVSVLLPPRPTEASIVWILVPGPFGPGRPPAAASCGRRLELVVVVAYATHHPATPIQSVSKPVCDPSGELSFPSR